MLPELLFKGLNEDKDVCFLRPDNLQNQARKQSDMPTKFQCIHEKWCKFEEPLTKIRSKLKKGKSKIFRLSMWIGSTVEPKELLGSCMMDWDNVRANAAKIKIAYKQMQVLKMAKNIILVEVPMDVDTESLANALHMAIVEARLKMIAKNPSKFGAIATSPKFALSTEFVKNTPYKE
jgi:hypothetical protein